MGKLLKKLLRNNFGAAAAEFALVVGVFIFLVFSIIDFGRMFFDWNRAAKATEMGVRFATVTDMVATGLQAYDGLADTGGNGLPIPVAAINGGLPIVCKSGGDCDGYGFNQAAFDNILTRMQALYPDIQAANLVIEYHHVGFGFSGNPYGSAVSPNVTVRLENMQFDLLFPGLQSFASLITPELTSTLTGEDFRNISY